MIGFVPALLLGYSATAATPAVDVQPPAAESRRDAPIVVTGTRIRDYRRELEECLARNCPPNEDVDATMRLAETLVVEGEYEDARRAIRGSIDRNRGQAKEYPEPVADLYRANSRVSRHLGFDGDAARSIRQTLRALQAGLPTEDHRHFSARLEIAQSLQAFGKYAEADRELNELVRLARAAGRHDVADVAELRRMWISYMQNPSGRALRRLAEWARETDVAPTVRAIGARTLLVRIYSERGQTARADAMVALLGRTSRHRQLLFAPPYELHQREDVMATEARQAEILNSGGGGSLMLTSNLQDRMVGNMDDEWIDVAFWITPEGAVDELQIVRRGPRNGKWEGPLLRSIEGRRYSASAEGARTYRLERYTYTSERRFDGSGSRISQRSPRARVEYFDLTGTSAAAAAPPTR